MTVDLRPVVRDDVDPLIDMTLPENQERLVAPNAVTLAQAAHEPGAEVFVLWSGDTRVGLMAVIDLRANPHREPGDDPNAGYLWRLLIAPEHQRRGLGRAALSGLTRWARDKGLSRLFVCCVPQNAAALALYEGCGFRRSGRIVHGEVELRLDLPA